MILSIDWDGVLHNRDHPIAGRKLGEPLPGAKSAMIRLTRQKHTLIIHTVMATTESGKKVVEDWMAYYKIPYDSVTATKPNAAVYIDDKALKHVDWDDTMRQLIPMVRSSRVVKTRVAKV